MLSLMNNASTSPGKRYYTANDITPNRCTITGVYESRSDAEGAIEAEDESGCFESSDSGLTEGTRAYHLDETCWA